MKIVVVYPYKFTDVYYRRYEIDFLKRFGEVIIWEMGHLLHPAFTKAIAAARAEDTCLRKVTGWREFALVFKELRSRRDDGEKVVVLQMDNEFSLNTSFRALICNTLIRLRADTVVDFSNPGVPLGIDVRPNTPGRNLVSRAIAKAAKLIQIFGEGGFSRGYQTVWSRVVWSLARFFPSQPTHRLVSGRLMAERYGTGSAKAKVQIVVGSSWDFSNSIAYKDETDQPLVQGRYAVLLDGAGPKFASDADFIGTEPVLTSDKWYPALTAWFEQSERETGIKIIVAGHPKTAFPQNPKEFGFRQVYYGCTEKLVKHAEFVIMRFSTALSYAVLYRKPIICIYNNQMKSEPESFGWFCENTRLLGVRPINLDAPPSFTEDYLTVSEEAYGCYEVDFLSSLRDPKPNHLVIAEEILGLNTANYA